LRVLTQGLLEALLPRRCAGCGAFETSLCDHCRATLVPVVPGCLRCGRPFDLASRRAAAREAEAPLPLPVAGATGSSAMVVSPLGSGSLPPAAASALERAVRRRPLAAGCAFCLGQDLGFARARSAFLYRGAARDLVVGLKHRGEHALAPVMAELAAAAFGATLEEVGGGTARALVTWVPSHRSVEARRGYNQARSLARALCAQVLGPPPVATTRKVTATRHQQGLGREARQHNLQGAFVSVAGIRVPAGTAGVVLVDDVFTTGATATEVAVALGSSLQLPVHVFTFARAEVPSDGGIA